ncbi:MAG: YfhO family protein [Desulfobacterales bacterium]|nr:YfhO family protein [Desulfobacterales bacterium]
MNMTTQNHRLHKDLIWIALIITISIVIFFSKLIFSKHDGFIHGDNLRYFFWNAQFIKDTFLSGEIPLWNPHYYSGHPFQANPATFIFYPSTLFYILLPLTWAFTIDILLHIFIAAFGMYFLVKLITNSRYAAVASFIVYCFNGSFVLRALGQLTLLHASALIPWVFYFIEKAYKTKQRKYYYLTGLIVGLQILSGDPQTNLYTVLFLSLFYLIRVVIDIKELTRDSFFKISGYYLFIPLLAFGVSAIQLFPSLEFQSLSLRANNTYEFATNVSFSPLSMLLFYFVPQPSNFNYWEFSCYLGILSVIIVLIGGVLSDYKKYSISFFIMLLVAVTIMLGDSTPVYRFYYKFIPLISTFRGPARCAIIFNFIAAVLAGFGVHYLLAKGLRIKAYIAAMIGLVIILSSIIYLSGFYSIQLTSREMILAISLTITSMVLISLVLIIKNKHVLAWMILTAIFVDLFLVSMPMINRMCELDDMENFINKKPYEHIFEQDSGFYRVNIPGYGFSLYGDPARGMAFNYYCANGNTPIILKDYFHFIYSMADLPEPQKFRHTFSREIFYDYKSAFSSRILRIKYALVKERNKYRLMRSKHLQPEAKLLNKIIFTPNYEDHIKYLKESSFNPKKTVLMLEEDRNYVVSNFIKNGSPEKDSVNVYDRSPNHLKLRSKSRGTTILLLSELYCPGWKAYVDGKRVPILRADYLLRAIKLEPGKHNITFIYRPSSFYIGAIITISTLLVLVPIFFRMLRPRFEHGQHLLPQRPNNKIVKQ